MRKPVWKTSSFLAYTGGLTVLGAAVAALGYLSGQYGKGALTAWALLVLVVLWVIAEGFRLGGRWVAAGIFAFASVIAWGVFIARRGAGSAGWTAGAPRSATGRLRTSRWIPHPRRPPRRSLALGLPVHPR